MENIVVQMLRTNGHKLYFYSRSDTDNRENHMEIDFLITEGKKIAPKHSADSKRECVCIGTRRIKVYRECKNVTDSQNSV